MFIPNNEQNTSSVSWYQQYEYDSLNRLTEVHEHASNNSLLWRQSYAYDRYGNRTINAGATSSGINSQAFEVDTTTNRLLATGDSALTGANLPQRKMRYDAAGNLTNDNWSSYGSSSPGAITRTYDAENRMTSAWDSSGGISYYTYNADGKRVRRKIGSVETFQVYGFDGELLAEYPANGNVASPEKEYGYRNGQLLITAEPSSATDTPAYNGSPADIPGTVQMENFDAGSEGTAYHDTTAGSHGQDYDQAPTNPTPSFRQPTNVDIYKWSGYSNGYLVLGHAGEWLNYTVSVATTGTYNLQAQVAWGGAAGSLGTFHVEVDGVDKTGPIQIPDTNWTLTTVTKSGVQLTAGVHVMRVVWDINAGNGYVGDIDYLSFQAASGQSPYTGTPLPIPGTVETEYFDNGGEAVAYHDTTAGTHGQDYNQPPNFPPPSFRTTSDVDLYAHTGYSNGYLIVMQSGDWMKYAVKVAQSGTYTMQARVVWGGTAGGTFHVEVDGVDKTGPLQIPNTNWNFETLTKAGVQLTAGTHMVRIVADSNGANGYTGDIDNLIFTLESASAQPSNIHWLVVDHLGSTRMTIDKTGSLAGVRRNDYLPFGEQLVATQGLRTTAMGYGADDTRQKFTSKERDEETGLDYFIARFYAPTQGRFTSVDPVFFQASMTIDPQRFNLYSYTRNNPLKFVDPEGEAIELSSDKDERERQLAALRSTVGKEAGAYLYANLGADGKYYVGVYTNGPTGKGEDFKKLNSVAGELAPIIDDNKILAIKLVDQGTEIGKSKFSSNEDVCKCNSTATAGTVKDSENHVTIYIAIPKPGDAYDRAGYDAVSADQMENLRPGRRDVGTVLGHELGHARALMTGQPMGSAESDKAALRLENKVRVLRGPHYSQRTEHSNADVIRDAIPIKH